MSETPFDSSLIDALAERLRRVYAAERPIPAAVPKALAIPDQGVGWDGLPALWDRQIEGGAKLASPWMIGHMDTAPHPAAALTEAVVTALNNNLLFRELSPFASDVEDLLVAEFAERLGLPTGTPGLFCSGGSLANLTALFAALGGFGGDGDRGRVLLTLPKGVHASLAKAAAVLGVPRASLAEIPVDAAGRMDVAALETALGDSALARRIVVAVLGGTVTGAVDDIAAVAEMCRRHGAWLHVDAIYGGALAYSRRHRHFLAGLAGAQSVAVAPHKWLYVPRLCALALFPGLADFDARLGVELPYSAGQRAHWGKWGLQGSRRADSLTLWTLLQVLGRDALARTIDGSIDLARTFNGLLEAHEAAQPLHRPELNLQAFRFGVADRDGARTLALQRHLESEGRAWLSVSQWQGEFVLRAVLLNQATDAGHLSDLLETLSMAWSN